MGQNNTKSKKIVIVGAGPGGLAAAMLLAKLGCDVTVLEKRHQVGGRTSNIEHHGFRFDLGPTFFLYPQALRDIFSACGYNLDQEIELIKLPQHYRLLFGEGGELEAYPNLEKLMQQVKQLAPGDAEKLPKFFEDNRAKFKAFQPILQSPIQQYRQLFKLSTLSALPLLRPWHSVDSDLKRYFSDPRIRMAFSFQSKYLGMSPFRCPSLFTILSFLEYEYGIFHPRGGCSAITTLMAKIAQKLGAKIHLNEAVTGIDFKHKTAVGVRTKQNHYPCDALVINADFAQAMVDLVPDHLRPRWNNQQIAAKKYSCSTYMMYLGVNKQYNHLAHHTIYLAKDYQNNLDNIEKRHRLCQQDPSFYVANPCVTDASMAPPGKSALYVLAPVTHMHQNVNWEQEKQQFQHTIIKQLAKIGITDLENNLEFMQVVTPQDWQSELNIYRGATFSLAHNWRQLLHGRPHNRFEDLDSVYLVGGGTHPGSGLPVIFESAKITSKLLMQDFKMQKAWETAEQDMMVGVS